MRTEAICCSRPKSRTVPRVSHIRRPPCPPSRNATSCQQLRHALQRAAHGLPPHRLAVAIELEYGRAGIAAAPLPGDPHRADRLVLAAARSEEHTSELQSREKLV